MSTPLIPKIGMRIIKTAIAVMASYAIFIPFGLLYRTEFGGVWGQLGPLYACIACIICTQSTVGQTVQQGISRLIGVAVGGALGAATLLLGAVLDMPWIRLPILGVVCVLGMWICLLIRKPTACGMACILPCVILITGVTGADRYYYAAARMIETVVGILVALGINAALPDHRPDQGRGPLQVVLHNTAKKLCVIGDPVTHSKSPLIQNTMLGELGLDYVYLCQPVPRGTCAQWLECAKVAGYAGFNATMPHKEELVPLMDELDEDAALFGAVNTVCIRDGRAYGYNTDGVGFMRALADEGIEPKGRTVVLLGAGGAAKAVALKLVQRGAARVVVCNRTLEKAETLCALDGSGVMEAAGFDSATLYKVVSQCDLLVNCTSLGMEGAEGQFEDFAFLDGLQSGAHVADLIYAPQETALMMEARRRGHKAVGGMGLLVNQAVLSLEHFANIEIDGAAMKRLLERVL